RLAVRDVEQRTEAGALLRAAAALRLLVVVDLREREAAALPEVGEVAVRARVLTLEPLEHEDARRARVSVAVVTAIRPRLSRFSEVDDLRVLRLVCYNLARRVRCGVRGRCCKPRLRVEGSHLCG